MEAPTDFLQPHLSAGRAQTSDTSSGQGAGSALPGAAPGQELGVVCAEETSQCLLSSGPDKSAPALARGQPVAPGSENPTSSDE